jgi:hypothetical protein
MRSTNTAAALPPRHPHILLLLLLLATSDAAAAAARAVLVLSPVDSDPLCAGASELRAQARLTTERKQTYLGEHGAQGCRMTAKEESHGL